MSGTAKRPPEGQPRDAEYWADPVTKLKLGESPAGAVGINVEGKQVVGPLQGFGKMWQKAYWVRLSGATVSPVEVIREWKENFQKFWPKGNRFYAPLTSIAPGEVAVIDLAAPGGMKVSTGVMVIYADEESFTFMTPEGHMLAAWITFRAYEKEGSTVAQSQVLIRANDPLWEIAMRLYGFKKEDEFWLYTLKSLSEHFGVDGQVQMTATCVDPRLQWSQAKNVWHNAGIRSGLYATTAPLRWARNLLPWSSR